MSSQLYFRVKSYFTTLVNSSLKSVFLVKDKRYLDLDCAADERTKILMQFLEDQERRGPPPPPTASEPGRRAVK